MARPMPREAPVTTATFPASLPALIVRVPPSRGEQPRLEIGPLAHLAHKGTGDHARLIVAFAGQGQAELLGLDHAARAARAQAVPESLGDLVGGPFLQGETLGETLDQIGQPAEAHQLPRRQIGHMRDPAVGQKVVGTHGMKAQAAHHHHVGVSLTQHRFAENPRRIHGVAGQKLALPHLGHTLRRARQVGILVHVTTRGPQERLHRRTQGFRIRGHAAPSTSRRRGGPADSRRRSTRSCRQSIH